MSNELRNVDLLTYSRGGFAWISCFSLWVKLPQRIASPRPQAEGFAMSTYIKAPMSIIYTNSLTNKGVENYNSLKAYLFLRVVSKWGKSTLLQIVESPWKEGAVRLEVKVIFKEVLNNSIHTCYYRLLFEMENVSKNALSTLPQCYVKKVCQLDHICETNWKYMSFCRKFWYLICILSK